MPRARLLLVLVFLATAMLALNQTMLSIALPRVVADLGATPMQSTWMLLSYMLVYGSLLVLSGQLSDSTDQRRLFVTGMIIFTSTSLGIGMCGNANVFIALRAIQAVGAAFFLGPSAAMVAAVFPGARLASAMGVYLAGFAVAQAAGPNIGGLIATFIGWRALFFVNVPIGIFEIALAWWLLRSLPKRVRRAGPRFDPLGNTVILAATAAFLFGTSTAQRDGWLQPSVLIAFALAAALVPVLVFVERRVSNPAIAIDLMRDRDFALANWAGFVLMMPRVVPAVLFSLYFQGVEGANPLQAAIMVTPLAVGVTVGSFAARRLSFAWSEARSAYRYSVAGCVGLAGVLFATIPPVRNVGILIGLGLAGLGTGVFSTLNSSMIMGAAPMERAGNVNGIRTMIQQSAITVGTAVSLSLVVGSLDTAQAKAFYSGAHDALTPASLAGLEQGYLLALGVMLALCLTGVWAGRRLVGRSVDRHEGLAGSPRAA